MEPLKEQCPTCSGKGVVPHERRVMANGEFDPTDFKISDICSKCGGGGKVGLNKTAIEERKPGNIADNIGG